MARKKKTDAEDRAKVEAARALAAKSPSEREALIVQRFNDWEAAKARLASERSETRTDLERARSNLTEVMEQGHAANDDNASLQKLHNIEVAWQDVEESKAAAKDRTGSAKDHVKHTFDLLQEAVNGVQQLGLGFDDSDIGADVFSL